VSKQPGYQQFVSDELKSLSTRSRNTEQLLMTEAIDPRLMLEFRTAVDFIRETTVMIQEWMTATPSQKKDVVSRVAEHQLRTAIAALKGLDVDLQSGALKDHQTLLRLHDQIGSLERRIAERMPPGQDSNC